MYHKVILKGPGLRLNFSVLQRSMAFEGKGPQGGPEEDLLMA